MAISGLLFLGLIASCYGAVVPFLNPRIVNGEDAKLGEIPYQVSLQIKLSAFHFCGGSILDKNYVITAAHCVSSKSKDNIQIVAGTNYLNDENSSFHNVKRIIVHENYSPSDSWKNDIALLEVVEPFSETKLISFINLPTSHDVINTNDVAVISGWGRLWQNGATTKKLQRAMIYIADQNYCRNMYATMGYSIHNSHLCAYDPESPRGSCHGDSGGPLTVNGKLVGLVSWAKACALTDYPTVYTRVSEFMDWIDANTKA
ncbi:chymotrypsin-2-like [Vespa crabro]|uniref:chymotrypsin-2-like n=1 Tax=Vespa crabro TaxID=7445 RepID=UPI001F020246|nr:chymotrypsin-2-like [Vespa crabro]